MAVALTPLVCVCYRAIVLSCCLAPEGDALLLHRPSCRLSSAHAFVLNERGILYALQMHASYKHNHYNSLPYSYLYMWGPNFAILQSNLNSQNFAHMKCLTCSAEPISPNSLKAVFATVGISVSHGISLLLQSKPVVTFLTLTACFQTESHHL